MFHYCFQNGKIIVVDEKMQDKYRNDCLKKAENLLNTSEYLLELARTLIKESHRYD